MFCLVVRHIFIFESHLVYFYLVYKVIISIVFEYILSELQRAVWSVLSEVSCIDGKVSLSLSTQNSEVGSFMVNSFKTWVQLSEAETFLFSLVKSRLYIFSGQSVEGNWKGIFEHTFEGKRHAPDMLCFHKLWWLHAGQLIIIL